MSLTQGLKNVGLKPWALIYEIDIHVPLVFPSKRSFDDVPYKTIGS